MSVNLKRNIETVTNDDKRLKINDDEVKPEIELDLNDYRNFRMKENNVGITEFISQNKGFSCQLKQRFSDFIVHEIGSNGEIVVLTDQQLPIIELENEVKVDLDVSSFISQEKLEEIENLNDSGDYNEKIEINVNDYEKENRTKIHKFLNKYQNLESRTEVIDDIKYIVIIKLEKNKKKKKKSEWPASLPSYLHFALYQENKGTQDALSDLAKKLGLNVKNIGYSGLKDKRAISTQLCSLYRVLPEKLVNYNKKALNYKFPSTTGNYQFKPDPLFLGESLGNNFEIVLRDVIFENKEDLINDFENVKNSGFINYFGIQRFGHSEYPSFKVGLFLIKKMYKDAIDTILRYRLKDIYPPMNSNLKKSFNDCLKIYKEKDDAKEAFKEFYWKSQNEGYLLKGLSLFGNNFLNALSNIPRHNRAFYCHSYQSFVWNKIASFRFKKYGLNIVLGDLVIEKKESKNDLIYMKNFSDTDIIVINESNIKDYNIFDVVLPLIGPRVQSPENLIKDEIDNILKEDGITYEDLKEVNSQFFIPGRYRRFLVKPIDFNYEVVNYDDNTIRLFETDLDKLNNLNSINESSGTKTAIKLKVSLPSSSYATVLIREISRQSY